MTRRLQISPLADSDLDQHSRHIAQDNVDAALRLFDAADATFLVLAEMPFIGASCSAYFESPRAKELRLWRIKGFPNHLILYQVTDDAVTIVRLPHASQDIDAMLDS